MNQYIPLGISITLMGLMAFTLIITGTFTSQSKEAVDNMNTKVDRLEQGQKSFIETWFERQESENKFNNETEHQLVSLARNGSIILQTQITNEENLLGNLSSHRIIANETYKKIFELENNTANTLNQTNQLIKFLADNFGTQSGYLEKENFQYNQTNKTFENTNNILNLLNNQTR